MKIGNVLDNRYEIRDVRKGGLGIVYVAHDREWKQLVAIKTFQNVGSFTQEVKNRFIAEATNWINIGYHENIVLAHYYNTISNIPYLFMEFVNGHTLRTMVKKDHPLSALVAHAMEICTALQHVYNKFKLIHRDIKPDNIFVTMERAGEYNIAKVADFGLSKVLIPENIIEKPEVLVSLQKQNLYATQGIIGTLFYVSPEQILGDRNIDCRSDIYSFGVMLYELVTHRLPFYPDANIGPSQNQTSLLYKHLKVKPPEPVGLNPGIPRSLNRVILKCLEKRKEKRFNNYEGLIDELKKIYQDIRDSDVVTSQDYFEIQLRPLHSETALLNNKGCSYLELGNYKEAIAVFDKILNTAPNDIHALCNKANALMRLDRCNESISLLKQALSVDMSDAETWGLLGVAYNRTGKHDDALACCDKALSLNANNPQYIKDKAFALKDLCRFDEAVSLFKKVTEIKPTDFAAWHELALLYERVGSTTEAIRHYLKALDINPDFSYSLDNLGCLLCRTGDFERGIPYIEKALKVDPDNSKTWNNLGVIYGKLDRYKEAIDAYRQAIRIKSNYGSAHYNLGIAYFIIGDKDSGLKEYEILKTLDAEKAEELKRFGLDG